MQKDEKTISSLNIVIAIVVDSMQVCLVLVLSYYRSFVTFVGVMVVFIFLLRFIVPIVLKIKV